MRCNIFKPLSCPTGEFLTFEQYTNDLTKAQSGGNNYRVVPSKFVVLDVDLLKVFNIIFDEDADLYKWNDQVTPPFLWYNQSENRLDDQIVMWGDDILDEPLSGYNNMLSQIFQSAYENALTKLMNEMPGAFLQNQPEYSRLLLWTILEQAGFLTERPLLQEGETEPDDWQDDPAILKYWDEIKYIGDINFHTDRSIDTYDYNEIYCHIPSNEPDYIYPFSQISPTPSIQTIPVNSSSPLLHFTDPLEGWSDLTYPENYPLKNNTLFPRENYDSDSDSGYYNIYPNELNIFQSNSEPQIHERPHTEGDDREYHFNTIILFYDVYNDSEGNEPLYSGRPMGIYFTGMVHTDEQTFIPSFANEFTKYITNTDAYGQGAAFGLRLMTRIVPTPNSSSYEIEVSAGDNNDEYNTITTALGRLGDAIIQTNQAILDMHALTETIKNHLALFKNNRTNIPYMREVNGEHYWFVNGRNTGMKADPEVGSQGAIGSQGETGSQGVQGVQGETGPGVGSQGATGSQGVQGEVGPQGIQGVQGIQGA